MKPYLHRADERGIAMDKGLLTLNQGDTGRVKLIDAGRCAAKRLYEMGFAIGTPVKVIKNDAGPVIVSLAGNKIALGRGIAEKVELEMLG
ncbi:MAG TPA: FeoA family protein [Clostridia bacterium]|nr:FeoA family protein [Clostridia bacterium]